MDCHSLFQRIFLTQGSNWHHLCLLHWQSGSLPIAPPEKSSNRIGYIICKWLKVSCYCSFYSGHDNLEADTWKDIFKVFFTTTWYWIGHSQCGVLCMVTNRRNVFNLQTLIEGYCGPWSTEGKHRIWFHPKEREVLPGNQSQHREQGAPLHQLSACAASWAGEKFVHLLTGQMMIIAYISIPFYCGKTNFFCTWKDIFTPSTKGAEWAPLALLFKCAKWSLDTIRSRGACGGLDPRGLGPDRAGPMGAPGPLEASVPWTGWEKPLWVGRSPVGQVLVIWTHCTRVTWLPAPFLVQRRAQGRRWRAAQRHEGWKQVQVGARVPL